VHIDPTGSLVLHGDSDQTAIKALGFQIPRGSLLTQMRWSN